MRICEGCGAKDRPALEFEGACSKNCDPRKATEDPSTHFDDCPRLIHEVRLFFRRATLEHTPRHPDGELSRRFRVEGWKLFRDGRDIFRKKMLCRDCIVKEGERDVLRREYQKACKAARGISTETYSQMLVRQSGI